MITDSVPPAYAGGSDTYMQTVTALETNVRAEFATDAGVAEHNFLKRIGIAAIRETSVIGF